MRPAFPGTLSTLIGIALAQPIAYAQTAAPVDTAYPGTLSVAVDATDLAHRIFHVQERIPVQAGPVTLLYPRWLPGTHSPGGPIDKLGGLVITGNGQRLAWTRDPLDVYAFQIDVPAGVKTLELAYDYFTPTASDQGRVVMTPDMLNLQWNGVALYPAGHYSSRIMIAPTLTLPTGWQAGSALEVATREGDTLHYKPVPFNTLVDSPVYAGRYFRQIDLDPGAKVPVHMDLVADDPKYLQATPAQIAIHRALVQQAGRLFGSHHYDHYDFLFSLSDQMGGNGLEHHQSSEDGTQPDYFTEWDKSAPRRDLLAHEYTHSWNGKFRRPADLWTPNFNVPMQDSLLWVYEGQTQYWGFVLAARSGLWNPEQAHDAIANLVATYSDNRPGFDWRNVQDTTNDPIIGQRRPQAWRSYQLSEDYYSAGQLIWLSVDSKLRELTHDQRSLDDFARGFFGIDDGSFVTKTYVFADVVAALNAVAPYDWASFLRSRLDADAPPLDGAAASGWRLVFTSRPSEFDRNAQAARKMTDYTWSLGFALAIKDEAISNVRWNGPAFKAGISGGTLLAVNGHAYKSERLDDAIAAAKTTREPIELLIKYGDVYKTYRVDYHEGLKYPHLERIANAPDRLSAILAARP
jgi:predicted metalloprotease with PDZ domain